MGQLHERLGLCLVAVRRFNKPSIMPPLHPGRRRFWLILLLLQVGLGFHQRVGTNPCRGTVPHILPLVLVLPPRSVPPTNDGHILTSRAQATLLSRGYKSPTLDIPKGTSNPSPHPLIHFPNFALSESCQLKETGLGDATPLWRFCLIRYVAGKFLAMHLLLHFIVATNFVTRIPFEDTTAVEKQHPYYVGPPADPHVNPIYTKTGIVDNLKTQSLGCKRSKITATGTKQSTTLNFVHISEEGDTPTIKALRRQYLMRSRAATTSDAILLEKQKHKGIVVVPMSMSSSDDIAPSYIF
ncbi:hypothetical protein D5086_029190 [Populus alba]|uniref:Uncharacterized protein n=1 Tax=Populus alba TaxID=43335 RepID=A0ACC4ASY5_POPAL